MKRLMLSLLFCSTLVFGGNEQSTTQSDNLGLSGLRERLAQLNSQLNEFNQEEFSSDSGSAPVEPLSIDWAEQEKLLATHNFDDLYARCINADMASFKTADAIHTFESFIPHQEINALVQECAHDKPDTEKDLVISVARGIFYTPHHLQDFDQALLAPEEECQSAWARQKVQALFYAQQHFDNEGMLAPALHAFNIIAVISSSLARRQALEWSALQDAKLSEGVMFETQRALTGLKMLRSMRKFGNIVEDPQKLAILDLALQQQENAAAEEKKSKKSKKLKKKSKKKNPNSNS